MIPESVQLAVIVALPGVISPIILAWLVNRGKKQDWARQDAVAAKAEEAARLLLVANERVAATAKITNGKLDGLQTLAETTHALVNSNMTASMQAELNATVRELTGLKEILILKGVNGGLQPSVESLAAIKTAEDRITELQVILLDRLKPQ